MYDELAASGYSFISAQRATVLIGAQVMALKGQARHQNLESPQQRPISSEVGRFRWLSGSVERIEKRTRFTLDGVRYEHANQHPELPTGSVRRFTYGTEPHVIAQVPLAGGGTVEVHGYATHYNRDWVTIVWNDDNIQNFDCWVPAADVRRPAEGEWQGRYVAF